MPKRTFFAALCFVLLVWCLVCVPSVFSGSQDIKLKLASGQYVQKADNILILFDKSGSMLDLYGQDTKFEQEKMLVRLFNNAIPDLKLNAGMREFSGSETDAALTKLDYEMSAYNREALAKIIDGLKNPMGRTPLANAIQAAANDLQGTQGRIALIIFSDGMEIGNPAVAAANSLKEQYGNRVCINTVQIGNQPEGRQLLEAVARASQCGMFVTGDSVKSDAAMTAFVENIFLAVKPPQPPIAVQPPPPPAPPKKVTIDMDVKFDFAKSAIKPEYHDEIKKVADFMNQYPDTTATIEGYTDSVGKKAFNKKLSEKRAEAVADYLFSKFNIDKSRLKTLGHGEEQPVDSNETAEGRQQNRRSEAHLETMVG